VTSFLKGRLTEANPVDFPPDALLSERNFVLNRDGTASRRLGMDRVSGAATVDCSLDSALRQSQAFSTFEWEGAGGQPNTTFVVFQLGSDLFFYDQESVPLTDGLISKQSLSISPSVVVDYASVDGELVVVAGQRNVLFYDWDGTTLTSRTDNLKIRDTFGVEDIDPDTGKDLFSPGDVTYRPKQLSDPHLYNLRNQTFGPAVSSIGGSASYDPIEAFYSFESYDRYPSNADNTAEAMESNPELDPVPAEQYNPQTHHNQDPFNFEAPRGYFIIDALERGDSREEAHNKNFDNTQDRGLGGATGTAERSLSYAFSGANLPRDITPGGATCVANYSGRAIYAGFSSEIIEGDNRSPKLGSYLLFSQIVSHPTEITKCYQEGDPTSRETQDLVASDGGTLRVNGAFNIQKLIPLGKKLFIIAENGVWSLAGDAGGAFSADKFELEEISRIGTTHKRSILEADGRIYYWTDDGIYVIGASELGDYKVTSLTEATIKSYFRDLVKDGVQGQFDEFTRKISWLTGDKSLAASDAGTELVFDTVTQSFSTLAVAKIPGQSYPVLFGQIKAGAFTTDTLSVEVTETSGAVITDTSGDPVTLDSSTRSTGLRSNKYIALVSSNSGKEQFTISSYNNLSFKDWESVDSTGVDAAAHLTMGYMTGGEVARQKQAPIVTFHFERTEQGFVEDAVTGAIDFDNPSSCFLQFQWDWADSESSNRWSVSRQAYRLGRYVLPANVGDSFDYGFSSVITKNKIRGKGRALSLHLSTEEGKDCKVLGYSMDIFVNGAV